MGKRPKGTPSKRPPAPSLRRRRPATGPDITAQIVHELYAVLERLGAEEELPAVVGSWRDTLSDREVLALLRDYNAGPSDAASGALLTVHSANIPKTRYIAPP
jgi:hypothetical protein